MYSHAFHAGAQFDDVPGKGGGGGVFYTGAPGEKGWDCTTCHINSEGKIRVQLNSVPAGLITSRSYTPGQAYQLTVAMVAEHRGLSSGRSNFNGFALTLIDGQGAQAGKISGFAPEQIYQASNAKIVSAGMVVGTTSWSFTWTAPAAGTGDVTMYLGMVDGNGADSPPTVTQTDPFGDDVVVVNLVLKDASLGARLRDDRLRTSDWRYSEVRRIPIYPPLSLGGYAYDHSARRQGLAGQRHARHGNHTLRSRFEPGWLRWHGYGGSLSRRDLHRQRRRRRRRQSG